MKHIITLSILILIAISSNAQDTLFFNSGTQIRSKVLEVKPDVVTYKMYENIEGPTYTVYKHELHSIHYQNGYVETIQVVEDSPTPKKELNTHAELPSTTESPTKLTCKKGVVKQDNTILSTQQVKELFKTNQQALDLYTKGKKIEKVDNILATASLIIVGSVAVLQLGGYVGTPAVIGACVYFVGAYTTATVFRTIGRSKIKESVTLYNGSIQK